ncbi:MAG: PEP-CTERM sorting domain-containing protein [Fimbriimonadaceae bacterium]|nr:PEP-CTERM sorting domain-containing protein [Fimbriimonadaceae bacterium]
MSRRLLLLAFFVASCWASASPIVRIGDSRPTTWTQGVTNNNVNPATTGLSIQASNYYSTRAAANGLGGGPNSVVPTLTPDILVSDGSTTRQSLVTSWNPTGTNTLEVAGWEYDYNGDPDLTGLTIDFEVYSPPGIDSLGIEFIDMAGLTKSWFRTLPLDHWDPSYVFNASSGGPIPPFDFFGMDPGFDLATVMKIRFTQSARFDRVFVRQDPTGNGTQWGAWAHLEVVPEPGTMLALGAGIAAIAMRRRMRKR